MGNVISRGTLPQNFLDSVTNMGLMLPTPQPQYLFSYWAMAGRLNLAALDAGAETTQQFVSMAGGGDAVSPGLDRLARVADMYPGFCQTVDEFGKGKGDTIKFQRDVYSAATAGFTKAVRELPSGGIISTTGQDIDGDEVAVVLRRLIGPGNDAGTGVNPYAIDEFDAKYRANKTQLAGRCSRHLRRDYVKTIDTIVRDEFRSSQYYTVSDDATVATMTAGAGHVHTLETWLKARKTMSDREWQPFDGGRYVALVNTTFNTDMLGDAEYSELSKQHESKNMLFGYIGSVQDIDFFECSTLASYAAGAAVSHSAGTVPTGVTVHESMLIGPGAVAFGTAEPAHARFLDDTNAGNTAKIIWQALHAIDCIDERGVQRVLTQEG